MIFSKKPKKKKKIDTSHLTKAGQDAEDLVDQCETTMPHLADMIRKKAAKLETHKAVFIVENDTVEVQAMQKHFIDNGIRYHYAPDVGRALQDMSFLEPKLLILDNGVPNFMEIVKLYGSKTIIFTGEPDLIPKEVRDQVLKVFDKADLLDLVQYLKTMFGYAGPLDNQGEIA